MRRALPWLAVASLIGGGCSDDPAMPDGPAAELVAGSGVAGPPLDGVLHVFVLDDATQAPVEGASITAGGVEADTDATGLATLSAASLTGAATVRVSGDAYAGAIWSGVDRSSVTVRLRPQSPAVAPPTRITATIAGWDARPALADGTYEVAIIGHSLEPNLVEARPLDVVAMLQGEWGADVCYRTSTETSCDVEIAGRMGEQIVFATIVEGDDAGTPGDRSDDTFAVTGYATSAEHVALDELNPTGDTILVTAETAELMTLGLPEPAPGYTAIVGIPGLKIGSNEVLLFGFPDAVPGADLLMPSDRGELLRGAYWLIGICETTGPEGERLVASAIWRDQGLAVVDHEWNLPPSVSMDADGLHAASVADAALQMLAIDDADGLPAYDVVILGQASADVPWELLPDGGSVRARTISSGALPDPLDVRWSLGHVVTGMMEQTMTLARP